MDSDVWADSDDGRVERIWLADGFGRIQVQTPSDGFGRIQAVEDSGSDRFGRIGTDSGGGTVSLYDS